MNMTGARLVRAEWRAAGGFACRARGFTLVEVLAATSLGLAVIAASYAALSSSIAGARRIDGFVEESAALSGLGGLMKHQLANAFYDASSDLAPVFTVTAAVAAEDSSAPHGEVTFSFAARSTSAAAPPAFPYYTVTYFIAEASGDSPGGLSRRIEPLWPREVADKPVDELIAPEVRGLEVACFDGADWSYDWDAAAKGLPLAVRVDLHVESERFEGNPWQTIAPAEAREPRLRVHRFTARPSWPGATSAAGVETTVTTTAGEGQNVQTGQ
jgi:prepilin-type N-terminal cleavage/methylation domain-containing protein